MQFIACDEAIPTRKPRLLRALAMTNHAYDFVPALCCASAVIDDFEILIYDGRRNTRA